MSKALSPFRASSGLHEVELEGGQWEQGAGSTRGRTLRIPSPIRMSLSPSSEAREAAERWQSVWEAVEQLAHHSQRRNVKNDLAGPGLVELRKEASRSSCVRIPSIYVTLAKVPVFCHLNCFHLLPKSSICTTYAISMTAFAPPQCKHNK